MDYTLTIVFADLGRNTELHDRLLTELMRRLPDAGPTLSANTRTGELTIALELEARDPVEAISDVATETGQALVAAGVTTAPLLTDAHVEVIRDEETDRVLEPA